MCAARNDAEDTCLTTIIHSGNAHDSTSATPAPSGTADAEESANNRTGDSSDNDEDFPEGGLRAWLVVFGSFCTMC